MRWQTKKNGTNKITSKKKKKKVKKKRKEVLAYGEKMFRCGDHMARKNSSRLHLKLKCLLARESL